MDQPTETNSVHEKKLFNNLMTEAQQPKPPNALSSSLIFGRRVLLRIKHVPEQLIDITVLPVIILLMFTYLFGGAVAGSTADYLQFIFPGVLAMTVTMLTMYTGIDLKRDIEKGVFDRFRTLPIWQPSPLVGALLVDMLRYLIAAAIMLALGLILGFRPVGGITGILLGVTLVLFFAFCLSWIWTMLALILKTEKSLIMVSTIFIVPFTFVSNVFVDPETLPVWLYGFVDINPISIVVSAIRDAMHGVVTLAQVGWGVLVSGMIAATFAPVTIYLYQYKKKG
ncbi:ABC transporter permease [Gracilibacillus alcaliphilus]|uniref:ABC transporter permease n=1 Tax=Gracilibacillus alcaliphilus TaxID=1401441 RepID=UPI00195AF743|nr:ABC transporter permease [Gracilibacillus alcaliphilus]MBM7675740.1 ABC-2 type transport system permease protein [Gracilibacillus alcaliphilus]